MKFITVFLWRYYYETFQTALFKKKKKKKMETVLINIWEKYFN